jgi:hypothetical protein
MAMKSHVLSGHVMDKKTTNRKLMPLTAKIVDELRKEFPKIKVLYAEEGQYRIGTKPDPSKYVVPTIDERKLDKKVRKK